MATQTGYIISSVDNKFNVDSSGNAFLLTDAVISGDIYTRGNIVVTGSVIRPTDTGNFIVTGDSRNIIFFGNQTISGGVFQVSGDIDTNRNYLLADVNTPTLDWSNRILSGTWNAQGLTLGGNTVATAVNLASTGTTLAAWTGSSTGLYYPLNSNPSNYVTSSATGSYVTTGDSRDINLGGNLIHGEEVQYFSGIGGGSLSAQVAHYYPNVVYLNGLQSPAVTGAYSFNSAIPRTSNTMFSIRVHGLILGISSLAPSGIIDFTAAGYAINVLGGNIDNQSGFTYHYNILDNGNDGYNKWVGINNSGNVAVAFGDTGSLIYIAKVSADAWVSNLSTPLGTYGYLTGWSTRLETGNNFGWLDKNNMTGYEYHLHNAAFIQGGTLPSGVLNGNYPGITGIGNATINGNSIVTSNQTGIYNTSFYPLNSNPSNYAATGETGAFVRKNDFILKSPIGVTSSVDWQNRLLIDSSGNNSLDWGNHYLTGGWVVGSLNSLGTISGGNIISDKNAYGGGIYTFYKGINTGVTAGIFSIGNAASGAQTFLAKIISSNSGFYVSKTYDVVHFYSGTPMVSMLSNTGPYNGRDFNPSFTDILGTGVKLSINNSSTISGDFVVSIFLAGSFTPMIVNEL